MEFRFDSKCYRSWEETCNCHLCTSHVHSERTHNHPKTGIHLSACLAAKYSYLSKFSPMGYKKMHQLVAQITFPPQKKPRKQMLCISVSFLRFLFLFCCLECAVITRAGGTIFDNEVILDLEIIYFSVSRIGSWGPCENGVMLSDWSPLPLHYYPKQSKILVYLSYWCLSLSYSHANLILNDFYTQNFKQRSIWLLCLSGW